MEITHKSNGEKEMGSGSELLLLAQSVSKLLYIISGCILE